MSYIINLVHGFLMAIADSVPGVSGGTIAFILGFYDNFINSINDLIYGKKEEKLKAIKYLFKLGIGWIIGFIISVLILSSLFEKNIYKISSLFLGFIIFSIPLIYKEEKENLKLNSKNILFMLIGIFIVILISKISPVSNIDITKFNILTYIFVFISGMLAISAMVLPGISGSTILLIFGLYIPIINSIKELLHLNFGVLPVLIIFGLGIITGILLTIKLINKSLEKYRPQTISTILGLMLGSIYAIILGPTTIGTNLSPLSAETFSIIFFIIGILIMISLELLKRFIENKKFITKQK